MLARVDWVAAGDFSIARPHRPVFTARVQPDSEIEDLSAFFHGWHVEAIQLAPQSDRTAVSCASFPSHRVLRLPAGSAFVVRGTVHKNCSCILLSASPKAAARFLGQPLRANDLVLIGTGANMDLFVPAEAAVFVLDVESLPSISRRALRICETNASAEGAATLARYLKEPQRPFSDIDSSIAIHLRQAVAASRTVQTARMASTARVAAVMRACQLAERRFPAPITLSDLSRHCGVAERTLEYGFKQVYETTPLAFIKSQRLTRSRMALLDAPERTSISQIARACGFTHMGQYSSDYRRLFGETPSMTLARGQSTWRRRSA